MNILQHRCFLSEEGSPSLSQFREGGVSVTCYFAGPNTAQKEERKKEVAQSIPLYTFTGLGCQPSVHGIFPGEGLQ